MGCLSWLFVYVRHLGNKCLGVVRVLGNTVYGTMVSHKRLQQYKHNYGTVCMTGALGCRWHRYQQSTNTSNKCDIAWLVGLLVCFAFITFWLYYQTVAQNSRDLVNWYWFQHVGRSDISFIFLLLTILVFIYVLVLALFALCHVGFGYRAYIHWSHRVAIVATLFGCVVMTIVLHSLWEAGWHLAYAMLQMTGPFIHICLIIVMTALTWIIAAEWYLIVKKVWRAVALSFYLAVMLTLYIFPPFIDPPCVVNKDQLPPRPLLSAHRGAAAVAPENTAIAMTRAADEYSAFILESDLTMSIDGVPFMHHDNDFRRTTNVHSVFPDRSSQAACLFNMSDINQLDAGSWYLKYDPFGSVRHLSEADRSLYTNQKILLFSEYLSIARSYNATVLFDLKLLDENDCNNHPYRDRFLDIVLETIAESGISSEKVWWLHLDSTPLNITQHFTLVEPGKTWSLRRLHDNNISHVNADFQQLHVTDIKTLLSRGYQVNMFVVDSPWLFSLYWCSGVTSITTNNINTLSNLHSPVWHMSPTSYLVLWLMMDLLSFVACVAIWIIQKRRTRPATDTLLVHGPRFKTQPRPRNRTMKEKLLMTSADSVQDVRPADVAPPLATGDVAVNGTSSLPMITMDTSQRNPRNYDVTNSEHVPDRDIRTSRPTSTELNKRPSASPPT